MNIPDVINELKYGTSSESRGLAQAVERPPASGTSDVRESSDISGKHNQSEESRQLRRDEVEALVNDMQSRLEDRNVKLKFNVLEENDTVQVEIVDSDGKTIRKIPDDDLLKLSKSLKNLDRGFFDEVF